MRKHLLQILFFYVAFEFFRQVASEIREFYNKGFMLSWMANSRIFNIKTVNFILFSFYPLTAFFVFRKYFSISKKKVALLLILFFSIIICLRYLIQEKISLSLWGFTNYYKEVPLLYYYLDNVYFATLYSSFGIIYFFLLYNKEQQSAFTRLQLESRKNELQFLKSQFNPHFLFNSLNIIYSLVYRKSDKTLKAIESLSEVLKYSLYKKNDITTLAEEFIFIDRYIEMQKFRFGFTFNIEKTIIGDTGSFIVPSFVLLPLIENVFKHGYFAEGVIHLYIHCEVDNNKGFIEISNKKRPGNSVSEGVGLKNLSRQLEILYPNQHKLSVNITDDLFNVRVDLKTICYA